MLDTLVYLMLSEDEMVAVMRGVGRYGADVTASHALPV